MAIATIVRNGEIFSPKPCGKGDILSIEGKIIKIGEVNEKNLGDYNLDAGVVDATDCYVFPGLIDPHQHIIGGSGEKGFASRSFQIMLPEIVLGGITTVVGCIGTDVYFRNMPALLAQAREFNEEGITCFIYSGGYAVPPSTLTGNLRTDMLLVNEVIGAGETAISDYRCSQPTIQEIARIVADCYVGGTLTGKCGITHFHMGDGERGLDPLLELWKENDIKKESLYPTHVNRNDRLLKQAADFTKQGFVCDLDTTDENLTEGLRNFIAWGGDLNQITISSDASHSAPETLWRELVRVHKELQWPWEKILPLVTTNPARILKFHQKGELAVDKDADIIVVDKKSLKVKHVLARGKIFIQDYKFIPKLKSMADSNRKIELNGEKEKR
jgi:beta-aspartyl-dipeptidase (metallo-type)